MLRANQLCFSHHLTPLLHNISFSLMNSQLIKVIGNNGCGKTTLLKILALLLPQDSGTLHWNDQPITQDPDEYREDVLYIGHRNALTEDLTPLENLRAAAGLRLRAPQRPLEEALNAAGLGDCLHRQCRRLSAGQKRRTAIARLHAFTARLWLLDEPLSALDDAGKTLMTQWVTSHRQNGGLVICTMHHADDWRIPADAVIHCTGQ